MKAARMATWTWCYRTGAFLLLFAGAATVVLDQPPGEHMIAIGAVLGFLGIFGPALADWARSVREFFSDTEGETA